MDVRSSSIIKSRPTNICTKSKKNTEIYVFLNSYKGFIAFVKILRDFSTNFGLKTVLADWIFIIILAVST